MSQLGSAQEARSGTARASVTPSPLARGHRAYTAAVAVALVGIVVAGALALVSRSLYTSNERRLLNLRVKELGDVLTVAIPNTQEPLESAVALADATGGSAEKFTRYIASFVGARRQFVSASLWRLDGPGTGPVASVGAPSTVTSSIAQRAALFARARQSGRLEVLGNLRVARPRLAYAVATAGGRFAVYAESALPADRRSRLQSNAAFSDLNYVIFLGPSTNSGQLLLTNLSSLPIPGRHAQAQVGFGDTVLTLVVSPRVPLGGTLPERLPWIILVVGVMLALGAAALTTRLIAGRLAAEHLAGELEQAVRRNQELYAEQRTIAQTLQQALLPAALPHVAGTESSARYEPGEQGIEVGGDWYDVIPLDEHRLLAVVGDVSGRGLRAATTMASLRYAIHAYAAQRDAPDTILTKLSGLLNTSATGQFATVLCAVIDTEARRVTVASAGHLPPLLLNAGGGDYLALSVGPPIGVQQGAAYASVTVAMPGHGTLLAFTDGLVERRGESIDRGLARLREAALAQAFELPDLLGHLVGELRDGYSDDDTAIVGLRWTV